MIARLSPTEPTTVTAPVCDLISQIPGPDDRFPSPQLTERWRSHGCGIACVRMVLRSNGIDPGPYWSLVEEGVTAGGWGPRGWTHRGLLELVERHGLSGRAERYTVLTDLTRDVLDGRLVVASVTEGFRGRQRRASGWGVYGPGGHLALVTGVTVTPGRRPTAFRVHHSSAVPADNWSNRWVDAAAFDASFSGAYLAFPAPGGGWGVAWP